MQNSEDEKKYSNEENFIDPFAIFKELKELYNNKKITGGENSNNGNDYQFYIWEKVDSPIPMTSLAYNSSLNYAVIATTTDGEKEENLLEKIAKKGINGKIISNADKTHYNLYVKPILMIDELKQHSVEEKRKKLFSFFRKN